MKKIRVGHTVSFVVNGITLYGIVEKIESNEEGMFFVIYANHKLYKNVEVRRVIHDYGDLDEE